MNTVKDILKENITQMGLVENLSLPYLAIVLGTAFACAMILYAVYKYFYKGAVYSENFGLLIVMSTMTVAFIIVTISSNIVLSLGMVGALSIVRFRTAVKDPLDVGFLFLAIGAGITAGAGLFFVAIVGTIVICLVFVLLLGIGKNSMSYLMIIRCKADTLETVEECLKGTKKHLKSKSGDGKSYEITYTIRNPKEELLKNVLAIEGVESALMLEYTGDAQY